MTQDAPSVADYPYVLTAQERRVAAAVGKGMSNKATARELGVTMKTVEYHLGNIYRKLHLESRVQLARLVERAVHRSSPGRRSPGNLSHRRSSFIGREGDLAQLLKALEDHSLVDVVGTGGMGKTRLALAAAWQAEGAFRDGAWLIELANVAEPERVGSATAAELGIPLRSGLTAEAVIAEALREQQRLLVLDNCEHVLDAAAVLVDHLGARCPRVTVLATSRERLEVDGERVLPLGPMSIDAGIGGGQSDAVRLFCERAADVLGRFEPDADQLVLVDEICRRLDGLPLAIELAAARLASLTLDRVAELLEDRFTVLTRRRGAPARQLSLRATVAWSYDLLDEGDRRLFDDVSVFFGGFDSAAATAVVGGLSTADRLDGLARKCLVEPRAGPLGPRYEQLETLRQFGDEHLRATGRLGECCQRHLEHFATFAAEANQGVRSADELRWHEGVLTEWPNLEQAFATACERDDADAAFSLVCELLWWGLTRLRLDLARWATLALALPSGRKHNLRSTVGAAACYFTVQQGDSTVGLEFYRRALLDEEALGPAPEPWLACIEPWTTQDVSAILDAGQKVQRWARQGGSEFWLVVGALQEAAVHGFRLGQDELAPSEAAAALAQVRQAAALANDLGNPNGIAYGSRTLGAALRRTDPEEALPLLEHSLALSVPLGVELTATQVRQLLVETYTDLRRPLDGLAVIRDGLEQHLRAGAGLQVWDACAVAIPALVAVGEWSTATAVLSLGHRAVAVTAGGMFTLDALEANLRAQTGDRAVDEALINATYLTVHEAGYGVLDAIARVLP